MMKYSICRLLIATTALAVSADATAQARIPWKLPEMIELEPSSHSDIVVPSFTVLELNGAYEVSFGMELSVDPSRAESLQVAGFTYEVDLDQGTYTLTEIDPLELVAGPVGFSSQGLGTPALTLGVVEPSTAGMNELELSPAATEAGVTGTASSNMASGSEAESCGRLWRILLSTEAVTYDPITINLAETEQRASWDSNLCQNRLRTVTRRFWANPNTFLFNTYWFLIDSGGSQSPQWIFHPWTWVDTFGSYQNNDFLDDDQSTWASHTIEVTQYQNIAYINHSIVHTGYFASFLDILSGDLKITFYYYSY